MKTNSPATRYYKVITRRGHQGVGRTSYITFYIAAENAIQASLQAQKMPGVKHDQLVVSCVPIGADEYFTGRKISAYARANLEMV